jgi:hypothetical protein
MRKGAAMPANYKHDDGYEKYAPLNLRKEFDIAKDYLLFNVEHQNLKVFDVVDEIYHWFCVKQDEVDELAKRVAELEGNGDGGE